MAGSIEGSVQDRRLRTRCPSLGTSQESTGHELRQIVAIHKAVLQERHHEEDGKITAIGLPVLPSVLPLKAIRLPIP